MVKAGNEVIENHTFEDGVFVDYYLPKKNMAVNMLLRNCLISDMKSLNTYGQLKV